MIRWGKIGEARVLRAGKGEWYNQPHNKRWDMGEDAQDLPPPIWHTELLKACEKFEKGTSQIVIDVSEMDWLVGHDWGFLLRISEKLSSEEIGLVIVAESRVVEASKLLGLGDKIRIVDSLAGAL